jgi:hypothetical protein
MPRARKTSAELRLSQPRRGRLAKRIAEENAALGIVPEAESTRCLSYAFSMECFLGDVGRERETFQARILPGQTVAMELGTRFNWRIDHPLTAARGHATWVLENNSPCEHRTDCERFLRELSGETQFVCDPVAAANIRTRMNVFVGSPNWQLSAQENFELVEICAWKKTDGSNRFPESHWQSHRWRNVIAASEKVIRTQL